MSHVHEKWLEKSHDWIFFLSLRLSFNVLAQFHRRRNIIADMFVCINAEGELPNDDCSQSVTTRCSRQYLDITGNQSQRGTSSTREAFEPGGGRKFRATFTCSEGLATRLN